MAAGVFPRNVGPAPAAGYRAGRPHRGDERNGAWLVGTPDDAIATIERLANISGGFGGLLGLAHEWAPREQILHSYELLARYVMPRYNGSLAGTIGSNVWARDVREELDLKRKEAIEKAHAEYEARQNQ